MLFFGHISSYKGVLLVSSITCYRFHDFHSGDSGGPLIIQDVSDWSMRNGQPEKDLLLGITSIGSGDCGLAHCAALYTKVSDFRAWIDDVIMKTQLDSSVVCPVNGFWLLFHVAAMYAVFAVHVIHYFH